MTKRLSEYVDTWLRFQSLWDLEFSYISHRLGDDLTQWHQLVAEIKKARVPFDNASTCKLFGPATVDYAQVQSKVNAKYDGWQRDVLNQFGTRLASSMRDFFATVSKARHDLEQHSLDTTSTADTVTFITFVQDIKKKVPSWSEQMEIFKTSQKSLERQRYLFPSDWLYVDQVHGEWCAFNEILERRNAAIQKEIGV